MTAKKKTSAKAFEATRTTLVLGRVRLATARVGRKYRAYCTKGDWTGPVRASEAAAEADAHAHQRLNPTHVVEVEMS